MFRGNYRRIMKIIKYIKSKFVKKKRASSLLILVFSLMITVLLLELTVDMGIFLNCRYQVQKAAELTALMTIAEFEAYQDTDYNIKYPTTAQMTAFAKDNFDKIIDGYIKYNNPFIVNSNPTVIVEFYPQYRHSRAIFIHVSAEVKTYFLSFINIKSLKFWAHAAAANVPLPLDRDSLMFDLATAPPYPASYSILPQSETISSVTYSYGNTSSTEIDTNMTINDNRSRSHPEDILGQPDGWALSLGPGGYIILKLPKPIVNGRGFDLLVHTRGNNYGYFIFLGNDADPNNPYPGGNIEWTNISCTSVAINAELADVGYAQRNSYLSKMHAYNAAQNPQTFMTPKVYGSSYFELDSRCETYLNETLYSSDNLNVPGINSAKYIMIMDDNLEDGFSAYDSMVTDVLPAHSLDWNMTYFPGQHASLTPGVSIDSILVLHNPVLITPDDNPAIDASNGLLQSVSNIYGYHFGKNYRRYWGCTDGGHNSGLTWNTCTSILDDGAMTSTLRMGHASPNMSDSEPYHKMLIHP